MMIQSAQNIPKQNFVGMSRLLENHAKSVVADRLGVNSSGVVDLIIWGNVNGGNYIDISNCRVHGYDGAIWGPPFFSLPAKEMIWDKKWLDTEFIDLIRNRKAKVEELLGHRAAMSQGAIVASQLEQWWNGSPDGQMFSLAVCSDGWFGVPEGLVCSLPVKLNPKGEWSVVEDISLSEEVKDKIKEAVKDVEADKHIIFPPPKPPTPPPSEVKVTIVDPKDEKKDSGRTKSFNLFAGYHMIGNFTLTLGLHYVPSDHSSHGGPKRSML
ncbi:hypothetical protein FSP39_021842 [Pinctada imbricata]|uniref:Lactate/malate dehydrogenase C-terminal domain-containing protein n=1 Tax=Pinctada imbricata TaxID=66713 RepID=A0AA89CCX3_PINIB|nr:hypothetical protein FSP39_021842 [Pinctada imbricata]